MSRIEWATKWRWQWFFVAYTVTITDHFGPNYVVRIFWGFFWRETFQNQNIGYQIRRPESNEKCNKSRWGPDRVLEGGGTVHRIKEIGVARGCLLMVIRRHDGLVRKEGNWSNEQWHHWPTLYIVSVTSVTFIGYRHS